MNDTEQTLLDAATAVWEDAKMDAHAAIRKYHNARSRHAKLAKDSKGPPAICYPSAAQDIVVAERDLVSALRDFRAARSRLATIKELVE